MLKARLTQIFPFFSKAIPAIRLIPRHTNYVVYDYLIDNSIAGTPEFSLISVTAFLIFVRYSFTVSFAIFKLINFILPLPVTEQEKEPCIYTFQPDKKYLSGALLLKTNRGNGRNKDGKIATE